MKGLIEAADRKDWNSPEAQVLKDMGQAFFKAFDFTETTDEKALSDAEFADMELIEWALSLELSRPTERQTTASESSDDEQGILITPEATLPDNIYPNIVSPNNTPPERQHRSRQGIQLQTIAEEPDTGTRPNSPTGASDGSHDSFDDLYGIYG
jgi:hypothetical protein